ncbi:MAG: hypothetical protein GVY08_14745 [Bacteroidetes bacterium]|jgi:hypothetical protein|nr:hypothetical protein [Bacteroidota bacterium]
MIFFLFVGLEIGKNVAFAINDPDPDDPNGWVCGAEEGQCDPNQNVTECTWGPGGCDDGPAIPKEDL